MNTRIIGQWEVNLFNTNSLMVIPKHKPIKDEEEDDDKDRIEDEAIEGLRLIHSLKLNAAEIEFVRGIYLDTDKAKKIGKEAEKLDISLSIHAPYYINLASEEKSKIVASKKRLFDSCKIGYYLNANYVVFHPAYYGKMSKEDVYELVKYAVLEIQDALNEEGY